MPDCTKVQPGVLARGTAQRCRHDANRHSVRVPSDGATGRAVDARTRQVNRNPVQVRCDLMGNTIWCLAFSPDSSVLAAGRHDGTIQLFEPAARKRTATFAAHAGPVGALTFLDKGKQLASADELLVKLWRLSDQSLAATMKGFRGRVLALASPPQGDTLATAAGYSHTAGEIVVWSPADQRRLYRLDGHESSVAALACSPNGELLAAGGGRSPRPGEVTLWETAARERHLSGETPLNHVLGLAYSGDGKLVAAGGTGGCLTVFDAASGKQKARWRGHTRDCLYVGYPLEGTMWVSAAHDNTIRFWDGLTGKQLTALYDCEGQRANGEVVSVALSPNGKLLAVGRIDGQITLWDVDALLKAGPTPFCCCCLCTPAAERLPYPPGVHAPKAAPAKAGEPTPAPPRKDVQP